MKKMESLYGRANVLPRALHEMDTESNEFDDYYNHIISFVNQDGSPGVPWHRLGIKNGEVLSKYPQQIRDEVVYRFNKLLSVDPDALYLMSAEERVYRGFCDPVRVFIKNEPHKLRKIKAKKPRLISSVSLVDQIIDRLLNRHINTNEISQWRDIPSKPGMGFNRESVESIRGSKAKINRPVNADFGTFDWTQQEHDLTQECKFRVRFHTTDLTGSTYERIMRNRFDCIMTSLFMTSDGLLIAQRCKGIQKSGLYTTSSGNSRMRTRQAIIAGCEQPMAAGDDCIEDFVETSKERYTRMGYDVRLYEECPEDFEFCSHNYAADGKCYSLNHVKELMNMLHRKDLTTLMDKRLALIQFEDDLGDSPEMGVLLDVLECVGWYAQ